MLTEGVRGKNTRAKIYMILRVNPAVTSKQSDVLVLLGGRKAGLWGLNAVKKHKVSHEAHTA